MKQVVINQQSELSIGSSIAISPFFSWSCQIQQALPFAALRQLSLDPVASLWTLLTVPHSIGVRALGTSVFLARVRAPQDRYFFFHITIQQHFCYASLIYLAATLRSCYEPSTRDTKILSTPLSGVRETGLETV